MTSPMVPGSFASISVDTGSQPDITGDDNTRSIMSGHSVSHVLTATTTSKQTLAGASEHVNDSEISGPRLRSSRTWKQKGTETLNEKRQKREPLNLLDLPVDVLKDIIREVTHTNDLASLALCHSALHRLAIPHIYSRFDIVWPDTNTHAEPRSGVDALTYGLTTLVMAEEIFAPSRRQEYSLYRPPGTSRASDLTMRRRRGNHYAHFTKKFSLGNGPPDWVQEYLIVKEGGKMLGTLVALAVARMRVLETFVWDMPTGILRDVWMSLSSLADLNDCRLSKVWVRWHNNSPADSAHQRPGYTIMGQVTPPVQPLSSSTMTARRSRVEDLTHIEHPSLSILPPLKSLSVLDIDELVYLDEVAVLIERSAGCLKELRIGIAAHARIRIWNDHHVGGTYRQIDVQQPVQSIFTIGEKRFGGVLGIITGLLGDVKLLDMTSAQQSTGVELSSPSPQTAGSAEHGSILSRTLLPTTTRSPSDKSVELALSAAVSIDTPNQPVQRRLELETLELERVQLDVFVLRHTLDWNILTSLTLLGCQNTAELWKLLQREFPPTPKSPQHGHPVSSKKGCRSSNEIEMTYPLNIKCVHTDSASPALLSFLKTTLAPNTLEVLFLQLRRPLSSDVTVEAIYKGPLRRHRLSLRKLLIDSSGSAFDDLAMLSTAWRSWMLNREVLAFICSGKMPRLRELGMVLEYNDWHFFLQNLPSIPHLRSLYIPTLAAHIHGADVEPRELAMQLVTIVALRPEVELCYVGIANKCFEILESDTGFDSRTESTLDHAGHDQDFHDHDDDEADDDNDDTDDHAGHDAQDESEETDSESSLEDDDEDDGDVSTTQTRFRVREILFYDDKVAIFRARHGRL